MALPKNVIQISTPSFTRVVDINTKVYTHYSKVRKVEEGSKITATEITYPNGKVLLSKGENNQYIIQNTVFPSTKNPKKKSKRPLIALELDKDEDRFFEDGSIVHGNSDIKKYGAPILRVKLDRKDDGVQELIVSFTTHPAQPPAPQQAQSSSSSSSSSSSKKDDEKNDGGQQIVEDSLDLGTETEDSGVAN